MEGGNDNPESGAVGGASDTNANLGDHSSNNNNTDDVNIERHRNFQKHTFSLSFITHSHLTTQHHTTPNDTERIGPSTPILLTTNLSTTKLQPKDEQSRREGDRLNLTRQP
uniref:Uncharacterized protein n=1 Tax=Craspedostauros australis TaxID=1486917 RepID=A0A7R9WRN6_9STRA|mmetsp:Transcript_17575/g.48762  ORF Transcript_17575/g.48762 Transcript_17575/m.48762 type:complete len:111 (+) Transcript_17575:2143-2475(+)